MDNSTRIEAILAQVRANGGRATAGRRGILRALFDHHDVHPTVEHLTQSVQATLPDVAESTVYRFLDELERLDVVRSVRLGAGPAVFHFTEDTDHHHLVCGNCGRTTAIPEHVLDGVRTAVMRDYEFVIEPQHLAIGGRCVDCESHPTPPSPHQSPHQHPPPHPHPHG